MPLYPYQKRVKKLIHEGKSVLLQAPTGTGKTRGALAPFVESFYDWTADEFPRKCIYSVPMRVLANQFSQEYKQLAESYQRRLRRELEVKIQTGERAEDPELMGDIIFATIDQSLSSALAVPYSLSPGRANINAGAFYSSYLVFDEFHLFPVDENSGASGALVTTLQLLSELKGIVPFVLMTATFSRTMLDDLAWRLNAEVVTVPKEEYIKIASGNGKALRRRIYHVEEEQLSAERVLSTHSEEGVTRSIVICNQVKRAQDLYLALRDHDERGDIEIRLLHSRFTQKDRLSRELEIRREFGKNVEERKIKSLILIATQVIEVGLDITCDRLHTEIAPANAIFQRAGRCARYPGELGHVHVYQVPERETKNGDLKRDYLPYPLALSESTWNSFQCRDGQEIDFEGEQEIIDGVHTESDRQLLAAMDTQHSLIWGDIYGAMEEHDRSYRQSLIRRIDSVTLLAADKPEDLSNPFRAEGFSLFRGSVHGIWRDLQAYAEEYPLDEFEDPPWTMAYPIPVADASEDITVEERFTWQPVQDASLINTASMVAINSAFCTYDPDLGFRIVPPKTETSWRSTVKPWTGSSNRRPFAYELESYSEHISNMLRVYEERFQADYAYVQRRLSEQWKIAPDSLDKAIRMAISCHDIGKLDKRWQRWVRLYQEAIGEPIKQDDYMAVHTHYDPNNEMHREAKRAADRKQKRPPHAGESTVAVARIIAEQIHTEELARATLTAIARHHSTGTASYCEFELHSLTANILRQIMATLGLSGFKAGITKTGKGGPLEKLLIQPGRFEALLMYLYIARVLRLSDGLSQEKN